MLTKDKDRRIAESVVKFLAKKVPPQPNAAASQEMSVYESLLLIQDSLRVITGSLDEMSRHKHPELEGLEDLRKDFAHLGEYSWRLDAPIRAALKLVADTKRGERDDDLMSRIHGDATGSTIMAFEELPRFLAEIETGLHSLVPDNVGITQQHDSFKALKLRDTMLHAIEHVQGAYLDTVAQLEIKKNSGPKAPEPSGR